MKCVTTWFKVYWFIFRQAWRAMFELNLGDMVEYRGDICVLTQGVCRPSWHMHRLSDNARFEYVHETQFNKVRSVQNMLRSFRSIWRFYVGYWADIWLRDPSLIRRW